MDKFSAQENVTRYRQELENGPNSRERRDALLRLLIQGEDKLGLTHEQLDEMDREIVRFQPLVTTQLELIAALKVFGEPAPSMRSCSGAALMSSE